MTRPYTYGEAERLRRSRRGALPHPSGDTKLCAECGKTIIRLVRHIPYLWNRQRHCSAECGAPKRLIRSFADIEDNCEPIPVTGCMLWTRAVDKKGYAIVSAGRGSRNRSVKVHRKAWELTRGEIPAGLGVLHRCDVRCCVNPEHLWLGTQKDNMQDCARKGRTRMQRPITCPNCGHRHAP